MAATNLLTFSIANNEALSDAISLAGNRPLAIIMPGTWTTANLTFQGSHDGGSTFQNVYDSDGNELTAIAAASRDISLTTAAAWALGQYDQLKIRSGTSGTPVNQGGARTVLMRTGTA